MGALMVLLLGVAFVAGHVAMDSTEPEFTFKATTIACVFLFLAACAAERL